MPNKKYDPNHYWVYVVELDHEVLKQTKFLKANPTHQECSGKPPLYVGMTGRTPEIRFEQHQTKYKSNKYVHKWGLRLRKDLLNKTGPMSWQAAGIEEVTLANDLRRRGYAVWQN